MQGTGEEEVAQAAVSHRSPRRSFRLEARASPVASRRVVVLPHDFLRIARKTRSTNWTPKSHAWAVTMASSGSKRSHAQMDGPTSDGSFAGLDDIATGSSEPVQKGIATETGILPSIVLAPQQPAASGNASIQSTCADPMAYQPEKPWADYLDALDDQTARTILGFALSESQTAREMVYSHSGAAATALQANKERRLRELRRVVDSVTFPGVLGMS